MNEQVGTVGSEVAVLDRSGVVIGTLRPGHRYRVLDESTLEFDVGVPYVMVRLPDHTIGYVPKATVSSGGSPIPMTWRKDGCRSGWSNVHPLRVQMGCA